MAEVCHERVRLQRDSDDIIGVPFHPKGERPSAPCPFCMAEKGDRTPKVLFGIIGPAPGDHDKDIPEDYFLVPPPKLNGTSNATGALRVGITISLFAALLTWTVSIFVHASI